MVNITIPFLDSNPNTERVETDLIGTALSQGIAKSKRWTANTLQNYVMKYNVFVSNARMFYLTWFYGQWRSTSKHNLCSRMHTMREQLTKTNP